MNVDEYQVKALQTAIYPNIGKNWLYPLVGLCGEVGEIANKCKKIMRDNNGELTPEKILEIRDELGDVQWYIAALAMEFHLKLSEVTTNNLFKLQERKEKNTIKGTGDKR